MQHQVPFSFSFDVPSYINYLSLKPFENKAEYGPMIRRFGTVLLSVESSRSKKQIIRAKTHWESHSFTVVEVPAMPDDPSRTPENRDNWGASNWFWDWLRYAAVLAISEVVLEDHLDMSNFIVSRPVYRPKMPEKIGFGNAYFDSLEEFAKSINFKFENNGFI